MNKAVFKKRILETLKVVAFAAAFFAAINLLSTTVFSELAATKFNNNKKDAYSFLVEKPDTIQIAGLGNSNMYSGIVPLDLWGEYGYASTVCASIRQTLEESHGFIETLFETQSPQLVFIDPDMLYDHNPKEKNGVEKENRFYEDFESLEPEHFSKYVENFFPVFRFHNYWQGGADNDKVAPFNSHGYKYSNKVVQLKENGYMKETDAKEPIAKTNAKQMDKIIALCEKNGAKVMLLSIPSLSSWNRERHNAVEEYARERGLNYLDLNLCYEEIGIDMTTCFMDNGHHLNYDSAKAATLYLGEYIKENYSLTDLRNEKSYESWNADLKKFRKYISNSETITDKAEVI